MDISIGIMAYNEGNNIGKLLEKLLTQKTKNIKIREIIVVSSGSSDDTNDIVKRFSKKNNNVSLVIQKNRVGKADAINKFLKKAKSDILVLESADTLPTNDAIENLCKPLQNNAVGIVGGHPLPLIKSNHYLGFIVQLIWTLHHRIALQKAKFGEIIAFRRLFREIKNTAVDEEYIAMLVKKLGFGCSYAHDAIVYNMGPKTISDFLKQRRRIYCGHMELRKKNNYSPPTMKNLLVLKEVIKIINTKNIFYILLAILLEGYGRILGVYDYHTKKKHYVWEIAKTTKYLS